MTLEEALSKIGSLESEVKNLKTSDSGFQSKVTELTNQVKALETEKNTLTTENATLNTQVSEFKAKIAVQEAETMKLEVTNLVNNFVVVDKKISPAEKDVEIDVLLALKKVDENLYNKRIESIKARTDFNSLGAPLPGGNATVATKADADVFVYNEKTETTSEGRAALAAEVQKRVITNKSDFSTELNLIREGR